MSKINGKETLGPDNPGAVSAYDENFAQSAEAVDRGKPEPSAAAIESEGDALIRKIEIAAENLQELRRQGADPEWIANAEERFERLSDRFQKFQKDRTADELRTGRADPFDGFEPKTLGDFLTRDLETGELLPADYQDLLIDAWFRMLGFFFDNWKCNLGQGEKNILAGVRRTNPGYLHEQGLSQQDVAIIFGETKAAVSVREIKKVEQKLAAAGMKGIRLGATETKSDETRGKCRDSALGNENRSKGTKKKRALANK